MMMMMIEKAIIRYTEEGKPIGSNRQRILTSLPSYKPLPKLLRRV